MARLRQRTLSNRMVDGLPVCEREELFWDRDLPGFGVRVYPSGAKVYLVQSRTAHGTRRATVGRHGTISADEARRRAASMLTRIRAGEEPEPRPGSGPTIAELAERYLREHVAVYCKPATITGYTQIIGKRIVPALGALAVSEVERRHVAELHYKLRKTPVAANDAVGALSRMFNRAEAWGLVPAGSNPCRFVKKYRTRKLERFLTEDEFRRLGETLDEMEAEERIPVHAAAALRLLMLTGCRCGEIVGLRWEDVDLERNEIRLRESKTGPRTVSLSPGAARVLAAIPRAHNNPWVIAGREPGSRLPHIHYYWYLVRKRAELDDVRIHDLRHSFASRALALGEPLPMIGKLLGHTKIQTTARYAHLAMDSVREAAVTVSDSIAADILPDDMPPPRRWRRARSSPARTGQ